ncbi:LutC/YkgG family protein [Rhodococcus chondri]|uniref:LUD domain-containing protein n=1 Tax=Rhodococcus chondri TaxID=3065941 RepID=A0ABU7JV19_9NOCA|nr:LUD domain-containing protein [Rhodococcus sp. CC-R104]MEE2033607.1 LUD domain-containing protein [Rhodococcus sp. CC-R104]
MTSRDVVLGRIRGALGRSPAGPVEISRDYRRGRTAPAEGRFALFADRLLDYKAFVHRCAADEIPATLARILTERGVRTVGVPTGLDRSWLVHFDGDIIVDSPDTPAPRLESLDGVVTASATACAETGTIFLDGSPDQGRRALTLVPDLHVCVVSLDAVEVGVPEALARLVPGRPTTLISGPSATSDIELERVEGVHGPRTLVVVIAG